MTPSIMEALWLKPEERAGTASRLKDLHLLKYDPAGTLPLTSGTSTDLYLNLRNARNAPSALEFCSDLFAAPLRSANISRFVEVPHAVSCFAGPLSIATGIPYVTCRPAPKSSRYSDAYMIGNPFLPGEKVVIIDDAITDGGSKITPIRECQARGAEVVAVVVLLDRESGWQENFKKEGISVPVWAGMTLGQLREALSLLAKA